METKITHIEKQRVEGIINPLLIQQSFSLSEMEHKQMIYDLGMKFLNYVYGDDEPNIRIFETSIYFWKWWKLEFLHWEMSYINHINKKDEMPDKDDYKVVMAIISDDEGTYESFLVFQKQLGKKIMLSINSNQ
jgi:hypothetical protein